MCVCVCVCVKPTREHNVSLHRHLEPRSSRTDANQLCLLFFKVMVRDYKRLAKPKYSAVQKAGEEQQKQQQRHLLILKLAEAGLFCWSC